MTKLFFSLFVLVRSIFNSFGQMVVPHVSGAGPLGNGSLINFGSGTSFTAIQENWGLNISGESVRPVKFFNTSLLVGYSSGGQNFGIGNAFISGNVGIGTTAPDSKLTVNGTIHGKEVKVDINIWPDFVFNVDYQVPTLSDLKDYIKKNHHLPNIPSEKQVREQGINLGEINGKLLQKIEELTLYLIKKEEELNSQKDLLYNQQLMMLNLQNQIV